MFRYLTLIYLDKKNAFMIKHFLLLIIIGFTNFQLNAQVTLIDTFAFDWTTTYNSFWGITDVNGQLQLGSDGSGDIFVINSNGDITSTITTSIDYNHGMVWDGNKYWVAEDFTSGGASLIQLDATGNPLAGFVLPPLIGGNTSGVGGLSLDGDGIWFSVYYPDFDVFPYGYAYKINPNSQEILDTLPLYGQQVYGIAAHGDYIFYVTDDLNGDEERIYAYSKSAADTLFSFPLLDPDGDSSPRGLHWFDDHLWLLAKRPGGAAFAYTMLYKYQIDFGNPLVPEMNLTTDTLDFEVVNINESEVLDFHIKNNGTGILNVSAINSDHLDFTISSGTTLPFDLAVGDSVLIEITFSPTLEQVYNNTLTITSNSNPDPIQTITLIGEGFLPVSNQEIDKEVVINIFPNPVQSFLKMEFKTSNPMAIEISITDVQGKFLRRLFNDAQKISERDFNFDLSTLNQGVYFLTIKNDAGILKTISFVKE